jgi:hypothetical protein
MGDFLIQAVAWLFIGCVGLIVVMLLAAVVLHAFAALCTIILVIISPPAFIFNPKKALAGYRLGKRYPYCDVETALYLDQRNKERLAKKYPGVSYKTALILEQCDDDNPT